MALYRTLLRVIHVTIHEIWVVVPGWNSRVAVALPQQRPPAWVYVNAEPGFRCFAQADLQAQSPDALLESITGFERADQDPDPKDGLG